MKYVLVDRITDNIVKRIKLTSNIGITGARTYFLKTEELSEKEFDKSWKVMTEDQYDLQFKTTLQNRQMGKLKYKWWEEESSNLDIERE
jgi:hypothetical protein|tara:strand:+ start:561 stop:827 length:267 start_codon:yes stop_codon:yes gene_type:complete